MPKTAKPKPAAFYIPDNYDPAILPEPWRDYGHYFLNQIHMKTCWWKANAKGYVHLKARYLTRIIPPPLWRPILDTLAMAGIVDEDFKIIPGRKCQGYRLGSNYTTTHRVVCTNDKLNQKIRRVCQQEATTLPVHRWLESKLACLKFDMGQAAQIITGLKPKRGRRGSKLSLDAYRQQRLDYCRLIANGDHWFRCDVYGRVHTPITALERVLRGCLTVNGQSLVEIDLANSQPLLLGIFARRCFASKEARSQLLRKVFNGRKSPYCPQEISSMANDPTPTDLQDYIRTCEAGQFYESLMPEKIKDKASLKQRFYRVLFGKNHARNLQYQNRLKPIFDQRHPSAARALWALKRRNYKHSAHVLQNYEATLFIHIICGRIMRERPNLVLYTVHDAIMTTPDAVAYVRNVILNEFKRLGVTPKLKETTHEHHSGSQPGGSAAAPAPCQVRDAAADGLQRGLDSPGGSRGAVPHPAASVPELRQVPVQRCPHPQTPKGKKAVKKPNP